MRLISRSQINVTKKPLKFEIADYSCFRPLFGGWRLKSTLLTGYYCHQSTIKPYILLSIFNGAAFVLAPTTNHPRCSINKIFTSCASHSLYRDGVWAYFLANCAKNLHVVLCMSPVGDALRNRCRNFPGLAGSTVIDWVFQWPEQALLAVAKVFLADHPKIPALYREPIIAHVVHVHNSIGFYTADYLQKMRRKNFVTPKHYLDYISIYIRLIGK